MKRSIKLHVQHKALDIEVPLVIKPSKKGTYYGYCNSFGIRVYGSSNEEVEKRAEEAVLRKLNNTDRKMKRRKNETN